MRTMISVVLIASTLFGFIGITNAHMGAKGIVKERMELMKTIGKIKKSITKMARGRTPLDSTKVASAAKEMAQHGARIGTLFPKGSNGGVSEASPKIWKDPVGFQKSTDSLVAASDALRAAAQSNDPSKVNRLFARSLEPVAAATRIFGSRRENSRFVLIAGMPPPIHSFKLSALIQEQTSTTANVQVRLPPGCGRDGSARQTSPTSQTRMRTALVE